MYWAGLIIILAGSRLAACESPESENVVGFLSGESFVRVVGYEGAYNLNVGLKVRHWWSIHLMLVSWTLHLLVIQVRTWHEDGQLVYHKFSSSGHLKLHLFGGILRYEGARVLYQSRHWQPEYLFSVAFSLLWYLWVYNFWYFNVSLLKCGKSLKLRIGDGWICFLGTWF